jgi:predicted Zn-dependent protease
MMKRQEIESILSRALNRSRADETFIQLRSGSTTTMQFADSTALPPTILHDITLHITVRDGRRYAGTICDGIDENALSRAYDRLASMLEHTPDTDSIVPFPSAKLVLEAPLLTQYNEDVDLSWHRDNVATIFDRTREYDLRATGSVSSEDSVLAIATSNGLFLHQPSSLLKADLRVYSVDGAQTSSARLYRRSPESFGLQVAVEEACKRCSRWTTPIDIKPERLTTIFTASAMADLLLPFIQQFSAQAIREDRSFLRRLDGTSFVGSRMFADMVTLRSDPFDTILPSMPFTAEGSEVRPATWVRKGVIETISTTRYDVQEANTEVLPLPSNLAMSGGDDGLDALIASTTRGLLVHGFGQVNLIDAKNCLLSASTRDGLFLIENGAVVKAVNNLVLRETPVFLLKEVLAMSNAEEVSPSTGYFPMHIPALKVKEVMYTQRSGMI